MRAPALSRLSGYVLLAALFLLWELLARKGWVDANYLPPVSDILESLYELTASLEIVRHTGITLRRVLLGFALGGAAGYCLGFACGYRRRLHSVLELTIEFLRPMPSVALIPICILFLGMGDALNVAIIAWACSWPVFINTMDGVRSVDPVLLDTARTYGHSRRSMVRKVVVPATLPQALTGLRVGLGIAVAVVVITEMVASGSGLGAFILSTSLSYRVPQMYAGIVVIGVFGYALNRAFLAAEARAVSWHQQKQEGQR
jgi:NitT/TauT family transport system permease protein